MIFTNVTVIINYLRQTLKINAQLPATNSINWYVATGGFGVEFNMSFCKII